MATADLPEYFKSLSLSGYKTVSHGPVAGGAAWREALNGVKEGVPESYELTKTLVFKPKTAKADVVVPVVVIASELTQTPSSALAKKLTLKEMRLADEKLLSEFFGCAKEDVSPLHINADNSPKLNIIFDSALTTSSSTTFAIHGTTSSTTIFLSSEELNIFLASLSPSSTTIDFAELAAEAPAAATPAVKSEKKVVDQKERDKAKKQEAKIEGAVEAAIGIKKEGDFPEWYKRVLVRGEMIDYYDISGCYILRPASYSIWQTIQNWFDAEIKELGVEDCYFPMFVSNSRLEKEKDHIEGFAPEVAWVTKAGKSDLEEPIAIRPTSETVMYPYYSKWIQSHRDLPLRLNQWNSVVRWEFKNPQPFLRTREFLWQEGHTAFLTRPEAEVEVLQILDLYRRVYEELLAVPVVPGVKSENEKFAGGLFTTTVEGFIPTSGRGIQGATSHCLGQNFSKMFDIEVEDPAKVGSGEKLRVWQNSWGLSTRTIGVMVMVHGDDQGLVIPPRVAATQVVVIPVGLSAGDAPEAREKINKGVDDLVATLKKAGVRVKADKRDGYTPGFKFNHWELMGVPLRLEVGPKDLSNQTARSSRRDNQAKANLPLADIATSVPALLEQMQADMFNKAKAEFDSRRIVVEDWEKIVPVLDSKAIAVLPWCEEPDCEDDIKDRTKAISLANSKEADDDKAPSAGAKTLCIPYNQEQFPDIKGKCCPGCGKAAKRWTMFGRSY